MHRNYYPSLELKIAPLWPEAKSDWLLSSLDLDSIAFESSLAVCYDRVVQPHLVLLLPQLFLQEILGLVLI